MKIKFFKGLTILPMLLLWQWGYGQVTGISYTVSPSAEYTWWDNQAGLEDGILLGGKLGIGFGEYLELRGIYMKAIKLKTDFSEFGLDNYSNSLFISRDVELSRWGGELKANLSRGSLLPYVTVGTGIQSIKLDTFTTNKQIYASFGGGIKISVGDRSTFSIEGKNTPYNFNSGRNLLTEADKHTFEVTDNDFGINRLKSNWSASASLQIYLGGRRPGQLSDLDRAYFDAFSGGLRGMRIPIEPSLVKMNFDNALPYNDTWMIGGYTGVDFNQYIGIRGYYLQALENDKISSDFDELAMYGGELRLRLNGAGGLTPYLIAGGGYLNVDEKEYTPRDSIPVTSQGFASGGAGITLPISNRFNLFGSARVILTSGTKVENLQSTDEIQASWMYSVGTRFILGKKSNPKAVYDSEMSFALQAQQAINDENAIILKEEYDAKVIELEAKLNEAYAAQDIETAAAILKEKEEAELVVEELEKREDDKVITQVEGEQKMPTNLKNLGISSNSHILLSPAEFEGIIEEILESVSNANQKTVSPFEQPMGQQDVQQMLQRQELVNKMTEIEQLLIQMNAQQNSDGETSKAYQDLSNEEMKYNLSEFSAMLLLEIQKLSNKIDQNSMDIKSLEKDRVLDEIDDWDLPYDEEKPSSEESATLKDILGVETSGDFIQRDSGFFSRLSYEGMSGFAGFNLGGQLTFNTGFRWHYGISNSKAEMMPEAFFGFGSPSAFGLTINGIRPIHLKEVPITPYLGAGAGFMQIAENGDDKLRLNYNFIFGTYLNVLDGRLYVDFTARNLFKFNQVIAGYRFTF